MKDHRPAYAVITPARNEADYIEETLRSMIGQTHRPAVWVIVDDGSRDGTRAIVERYARDHPFIRLLKLEDEKHGEDEDRYYWGPDAIVFNKGLDTLDWASYDFIGKLDGDMRFDPDYYERLLAEFERDPRLGIAAGECYEYHGGKLVMEKVARGHVRGALKTWRRECFEEVGGVVNMNAWDAVDEARAQIRGWRTRGFPDLVMVHLRPACSATGMLSGRVRLGAGAYLLHYRPSFALARAVKYAFKKPYVIGGLGFLWGFARSYVKRPARLDDPEVVGHIRATQLRRLTGRGSPARAAGADVG